MPYHAQHADAIDESDTLTSHLNSVSDQLRHSLTAGTYPFRTVTEHNTERKIPRNSLKRVTKSPRY